MCYSNCYYTKSVLLIMLNKIQWSLSSEHAICAAIWWICRQLLLEHFSDAAFGPSSFREAVAEFSTSTFHPLSKSTLDKNTSMYVYHKSHVISCINT